MKKVIMVKSVRGGIRAIDRDEVHIVYTHLGREYVQKYSHSFFSEKLAVGDELDMTITIRRAAMGV